MSVTPNNQVPRPKSSDTVKKPPQRYHSDNPFRESMLRLLNTVPPPREDPDEIKQDTPPAIDEQKVADIPKLGSLEEGIDLFEALGRNIQLQQGVGVLTYRAQKLEYLKKANEAKRCVHMKASGIQCGSPAVGGKSYCFFHQMIHNGHQDLPTIEDQRSMQIAYLDLARRVMTMTIPVQYGKLLLQVLQSVSKNLPDGDWDDGYEEI